MIANEVNINKQTIHQMLDEELRNVFKSSSKVRPAEIPGRAEATEAHIVPRLQLDLSGQS
jgi:hypothetical protein